MTSGSGGKTKSRGRSEPVTVPCQFVCVGFLGGVLGGGVGWVGVLVFFEEGTKSSASPRA